MKRNVAHSCFGFPQVQWLFAQSLALLEMRGAEMTQAQQHHQMLLNTSSVSSHANGGSSNGNSSAAAALLGVLPQADVTSQTSGANPDVNLLQQLCQF